VSNTPLTQEEILRIEQLYSLASEERYYDLLGIERTATAEQIRQSYHSISRQWHPDRFFRRDLGNHQEKLEFLFMEITKAYRTLSAADSRLDYDREKGHRITIAKTEESEGGWHRHRRGRRRRRTRANNRVAEEATPQPNPSPQQERGSIRGIRAQRREALLEQVQQGLQEQTQRADTFFEAGKTDLDKGRPLQAAASLHIACKLDPENQEYKIIYKEARKQARQIKSKEFFATAESAESFQNYHEALKNYRKAVEYEIDDARAYARLAYLIEKLDPDPRETIRLMQIAVQKAEDNAEYRCILGEIYLREGMKLNARREFNKALELERNYTRAKEGLKNA
jgi:curved DNA-binding protein CbpA